MQDRRQDIIDAGLDTLREHGYIGFTQPRVAKRAGMRQSLLTYYFPTRLVLLTAVARAAVDRQLAAVDKVLGGSADKAVQTLTTHAIRPETTRVLMAMAQAADKEPVLRELFVELTDGIVARFDRVLKSVDKRSTLADARLLHAIEVGVAVVDLATGRSDGAERNAEVLKTALQMVTAGKR